MASRRLCRRALKQYEEDLGQRPNVVGLGVVPCEQEFAVAVYMRHKVEDIPPSVPVNHRGVVIDVPVRVFHHGPIVLE